VHAVAASEHFTPGSKSFLVLFFKKEHSFFLSQDVKMQDAALLWGGDLSVGPTGDLALVDGTTLGQQRVLRRLLTNPGDYIWHLDYGAGLAQFVGQTANVAAINATIRSQIFMEASVARLPEPVIEVQSVPDGSVYVYIRYVDATNGATQVLSFSVSN
jgi:phage baseplate assembly protein W